MEHHDYPARPADDFSASRRQTRRAFVAAATAAGAAMLTCRAPASAVSEREAFVEHLLDEMSLERRIAQLFIFQALGTQMTDSFASTLKAIRPGGVIFVAPNIGKPDQIKAFVKAIHRSNRTAPPLIAIDQEGGDVIRLPGDPAPGARVMGTLSNDDVRAKSRDRAKFLAEYGFDVNFAPVADVAYEANSTMYLRSFGSDPETVAEKVSAVVRGARSRHVMGAAKHFPGHGRTSVDSHRAIPTVDISKKRWNSSDALPFRAAIRAGVEMVMVGHLHYSKWDDSPMSLSKVSVKTLRNDLEFDGLIVTDDLGMGALAGIDSFDVLDRATDAGMDLLLYTAPPTSWESLVQHVAKRVRAGDVSEKRINASVRRILRLKVDHFGLDEED